MPKTNWKRTLFSALAAIFGLGFSYNLINEHGFTPSAQAFSVPVKEIGRQMLNPTAHGYILPFEVVSMLLLAAMIGCIVIAMKSPGQNVIEAPVEETEVHTTGGTLPLFRNQKSLRRYNMASVPLEHILFVSTALFFIGMYGLFTRRNMITMLMSIELILNSVNINFIAFNKFLWPGKLDGIFFTIFIITIAAAEAAVAIAIIINLYRSHKSIDIEDAAEMKF